MKQRLDENANDLKTLIDRQTDAAFRQKSVAEE